MASEMVNFTRDQILLQAGTAMLAQANSAPQTHPAAPPVASIDRPAKAQDSTGGVGEATPPPPAGFGAEDTRRTHRDIGDLELDVRHDATPTSSPRSPARPARACSRSAASRPVSTRTRSSPARLRDADEPRTRSRPRSRPRRRSSWPTPRSRGHDDAARRITRDLAPARRGTRSPRRRRTRTVAGDRRQRHVQRNLSFTVDRFASAGSVRSATSSRATTTAVAADTSIFVAAGGQCARLLDVRVGRHARDRRPHDHGLAGVDRRDEDGRHCARGVDGHRRHERHAAR